MRITPIYRIAKNPATWLEEHSDLIFDEILQSAEEAAKCGWSAKPIPVLALETDSGPITFLLASTDAAKTSLELAIAHFIEVEAYEKAARVRDCQKTLPT